MGKKENNMLIFPHMFFNQILFYLPLYKKHNIRYKNNIISPSFADVPA